MAKELAITPGKCIGCSCCMLACSLTYSNGFDKNRSHVVIRKKDFEGTYEIRFKSTCVKCCKCAEACPVGCLRVLLVKEEEQ